MFVHLLLCHVDMRALEISLLYASQAGQLNVSYTTDNACLQTSHYDFQASIRLVSYTFSEDHSSSAESSRDNFLDHYLWIIRKVLVNFQPCLLGFDQTASDAELVAAATDIRQGGAANSPERTSNAFKSGNERLYEAYNDFHSLAQDFEKPFDAPAILVVGHQTDGKSGQSRSLTS